MEPTKMFVCEINRLFLHTNQLYQFEKHPDCKDCELYYNPPEKTKTVFYISCETGCSCCSGSDDHYRGFYESREIAEKRISYYKKPDSKFWPVCSQYAKRGRYTIYESTIELLPDGRVIWEDKVLESLNIAQVNNDGSVDNNETEYLLG